jgi:CcmD family protein
MVENELEFLFAGFAVFWAGLFVYLVILQARLRDLQRELAQLEERLEEVTGEPARGTISAPNPVTPSLTADAASIADAATEPTDEASPDASPDAGAEAETGA